MFAKVASGAPVVAVDGDVFVEVANPLDVWLVVQRLPSALAPVVFWLANLV